MTSDCCEYRFYTALALNDQSYHPVTPYWHPQITNGAPMLSGRHREHLARLAGFEPTTSAFAGLRSIQLSYKRTGAEINPLVEFYIDPNKFGAEGESRTRTPLRALRPERSASAISPPRHGFFSLVNSVGGRWGTRTSDLLRVKQAL